MVTPTDYVGNLMELANNRRGEFVEMKYLTGGGLLRFCGVLVTRGHVRHNKSGITHWGRTWYQPTSLSLDHNFLRMTGRTWCGNLQGHDHCLYC
jgi:hypothetical protein